MRTTETAQHKRQAQGKESYNQIKTIFQYLHNNIATASMVAEVTGIPHKNICRYKRDLELSGSLFKVEKGICKKTGFKAWYITCDPDYSPKVKQLNLF